MELKPFHHEAQIALDDDFTLQLVLDLRAVDFLERMLGKSMHDIIGDMLSSISLLTKVLWGVTRDRHSDLSLEQVAGILLPGDPEKQELANAVVTLLGDMMRRAFLIDAEPSKKVSRRRG